jgi:hypothetical protein
MCQGTCLESDIKMCDELFLLNIQHVLTKNPQDSVPDKNSLMYLINHTFYQRGHPQLISI